MKIINNDDDDDDYDIDSDDDIAEKKVFEKAERQKKFHSDFKSVSFSVSVGILHSNGHLEVD